MLHGEDYDIDYEIEEECITDENELETYLGSNKLASYGTYLYYNQEYFDADEYGAQSIKIVSQIS